MPPMTTTGDISYRTAGYFSKQLLERSQPLLVLDKFGQPKPLPAHSTRTIKFRGYEHLPNQPKALIEGVTPQASKPTFKDIEATINQYGDWIELTDVLADTHEDPLISEFSDILGEQAAIMRERITAGVVLGGTNVFSARQKEDSWNRPSLPAPNWTLPNKRRTFAFWPAVRIPTAAPTPPPVCWNRPFCRAARPWTASG